MSQTGKLPADLWREVPRDDEEFWSDARERQRQLVKVLIEGALEEEMALLLGAGRYRRTESRQGSQNGFYERDLATPSPFDPRPIFLLITK